MNTDDVSLALYIQHRCTTNLLLPTASFLIYSSFQDLHARQLKKSLTNPMTETIDRLWSHPNQKKKKKRKDGKKKRWRLDDFIEIWGGEHGRSPRGIMHLNSSAFQSCQGYMDCRFNRVVGISISPLSTLRCQVCTLMRQWSPAGFSDRCHTPHWKEATRHDRPSHK